MGILIDTDVIIEAEKGTFSLEKLLKQYGEEEVGISSITASELLHGVECAKSKYIKKERSAFVEGILKIFPIFPFGIEEARTHARIWAELKNKEEMIGVHDLIIGATALTLKFKLVTFNIKGFKRIQGLKIISPNKL